MRIQGTAPVSAKPAASVATEKACIDRIEKTASGKGIAVVLVGEAEKQFDVPVSQLPKGIKEGDWLQVEIKGDKLVGATYDAKETAARKAEIAKLFESVFESPAPVQQKAVCDRIEKLEDGKALAVLLVGDEEKVVNVPVDQLPAGLKEGDCLTVDMQGDKVVGGKIDKAETEDRRNFIQKLFDSLFN